MHTAGVDLGGTKVQGVVVGDDGARLGEARGKTPVEGGPAAVVAEITGVVKAAAKAAKVPVGKLAGVGIGSPGRIDPDTGDLFGAANLPGFGDPVPLGTMVADALGVKRVVVDNDVVVATLAEHRLGAGRGFDDLLSRVRRVGGGRRPRPRRPAARRRPRGRRRDRPHGGGRRRRAVPVRAPRLHGGLRRPDRPGARRPGGRGRRPPDRAAGHPAAPAPPPDEQRRLEGRPGRRRPAGPRADRPRGRGPRRRHRLGRQPGRRPGRPDRRRPRRQARRAVRPPDRDGHDPPPVPPPLPGGRPPGRASATTPAPWARPCSCPRVRRGPGGRRRRRARGRRARRRRRPRTSSGRGPGGRGRAAPGPARRGSGPP